MENVDVNRNECVSKFCNLIYQSLSRIIDDDYIYLDLPYYPNIGDSLIWKGTEVFLKSLPYKCLYRASILTCKYPKISKNVIVVLQGGGNFGDVWRDFQEFRLRVIEYYKENKIVVLPQSVYYTHLKLARKDAASMRIHNNLTICARDRLSFIFLRAFRFASKVIMLPDMAFCIGCIDVGERCNVKDTILMVRRDAELNASALDLVDRQSNCVVQDWISIEAPDVIEKEFYTAVESDLDKTHIDELAQTIYLPHIVKRGVEQLKSYQMVQTTRLHGCILSILMNKKVVLIDNSYGKNRSFYHTWLEGVDGVSFVGDRKKIGIYRICQLIKHVLLSLIEKF